jgi:5-methylcytosine-specific restriction protein A
MNYVWYVGYGSNLLRERFLGYIQGGRFRLGGRKCQGCKDKTPPVDNEPTTIAGKIYFAENSSSWFGGGIAFIKNFSPEEATNGKVLARMWKITEEQFDCVRDQEGRNWYDMPIDLGERSDGSRMVALTSSRRSSPSKPSKEYLSTIALGLREAFGMGNKEIKDYLRGMSGIVGFYSEGELDSIFL